MSETPRSDDVKRVKSVTERFAKDLLRQRNVVATGVGYKLVGGTVVESPCVVVSVTQKMPASQLAESDLVPHMIDGIETDVVETGEIIPMALNRLGRVRPVRPGVSVGHVNGSAGTAGCIVTRDGEPYLLSNNHVLALLNEGQIEDAILQPGPGDGGSLLDAIGTLSEYVPLRFNGEDPQPVEEEPPEEEVDEPSGCAALLASLLESLRGGGLTPTTAQPVPAGPVYNYVDAALVKVLDTVEVNPDIVDVGGPPLGIIEPNLGTRVIKSGRTSGLTQGNVIQVDVTVDVRYGDRVARFVNQMMTTPMSKPGDSGSLVLDYERNAVGLLFSGSDLVTVINPIISVLKALKVDLVLEGS